MKWPSLSGVGASKLRHGPGCLRTPLKGDMVAGADCSRGIAAVMRVLRHARGDRPEPGRLARRGVGPHDAADCLSVFVEDLVVVFELAAAEVGWFEGEHGGLSTK